MLNIREDKEGILIPLKVIPHASRDIIAGVLEEFLKVKVTKAPEEGRANRAVESLLASFLGIKKQQVSIVQGRRNKNKVARIVDISLREVLKKFKNFVS
jgi:uncharacterized protein (TIGR00251 family)